MKKHREQTARSTASARDLTEGSPARLLVSVALPLMLGNVFQQLYTVVDAQIVGRVEGVSALAALGSCDWFNWLFLGIIQGFAQGFAIPMAQAFGAKDFGRLRRCVGNTLLLAALVSAITAAAALLSIRPVLALLGSPAEVRPLSVSYLTVLFAALPVVMAYNLMASILRALGDGRTPLYAMMIACFVNILLDLLFVAVYGWGVVGAAAATVIAQGCSCVFCLLRLRQLVFLHPARADLRPQRAVMGGMMRLGIPIAAQNMIIGVGGMIVQSVVNAQGVTFMAGYAAASKLYGVLEIAAISYGYAAAAYTGQNLGAGKIGRIRKGVRSAALTGVGISAVIAGIMFLAGRAVISGFISGAPQEVEQSVAFGCEFLYLMSGCLPILYLLHIYRSALQGMGSTVMPMISGLVEFVMRTAAAFLLPAVIGRYGVYLAEVLAWIGADLILLPAYARLMVRLKRDGA